VLVLGPTEMIGPERATASVYRVNELAALLRRLAASCVQHVTRIASSCLLSLKCLLATFRLS
jgi:hypothetical protein